MHWLVGWFVHCIVVIESIPMQGNRQEGQPVNVEKARQDATVCITVVFELIHLPMSSMITANHMLPICLHSLIFDYSRLSLCND